MALSEPACATVTFTEVHALAPPRALLTRRAVLWAADALTDDDTTVAALARRLDVDWHTLWDALKVEAHRRADDPGRLAHVTMTVRGCAVEAYRSAKADFSSTSTVVSSRVREML